MSPDHCERLAECKIQVLADDFRRMVERHQSSRWGHSHKPKVPAWMVRVIEERILVAEANVGRVLRFPCMMLTMARLIEVGPRYFQHVHKGYKKPRHYYLLDDVMKWLHEWGVQFYPGLLTPEGYIRMYYRAAIGKTSPKSNTCYHIVDLNPPENKR